MIDQLLQNPVVSSPIPCRTRPCALLSLALTAWPTSSSSSSDCSSGSWSASTIRDRQAPTKNRLPAAPSASLRTSGTGIFGARLFVDADVLRHTFGRTCTLHPLMMTIRSTAQALSRQPSAYRNSAMPPRASNESSFVFLCLSVATLFRLILLADFSSTRIYTLASEIFAETSAASVLSATS